MPKGYIDCHKCKWSHKLYDYTGKWTGAVFCSKRNGKVRKRFRGECKYIKDEPQTERAETMSCQECKHYEVGKPCKPFLNECDCHYEPKTENE